MPPTNLVRPSIRGGSSSQICSDTGEVDDPIYRHEHFCRPTKVFGHGGVIVHRNSATEGIPKGFLKNLSLKDRRSFRDI